MEQKKPDDFVKTIDDEVLRERIRKLIIEPKQSSFWLRVFGNTTLTNFLLNALIAGLVGAGLTYYYDVRKLNTENALIAQRAKEDRELKRHEAEVGRAADTFDQLSRVLDKRLYRTWQLIWAYKSNKPEDIKKQIERYDEVRNEWNESLNRNLALTRRFFGNGMRDILEYKIYYTFSSLNDTLARHRSHLDHNTKDDAAELEKLDEYVRQVFQPCIYTFNVDMLTQIQESKIGALDPNLNNLVPIAAKKCPDPGVVAQII
jgi:hypothetical protein